MLPIWLALAAQKLSKLRQDKEEKDQAQARISGDFASSLGMPTYGLQAAETQHHTEQGNGPSYLAAVLQNQGQQAQSASSAPLTPSADEEDPYNLYRRRSRLV